MKLDPLELQQIDEFVTIYKTLPPEQKEVARGKACALSNWQGTTPHTRALNAYLHRQMCIADAVEKAGAVTSYKDVPVPTTAEVLRGLKPLAVFVGAAAVICAVGYLFVLGVVSVGRAIEAFFVANGGWIVGGAFGVVAFLFLLSGLRGEKAETVETEVKAEKRGPVIVNVNVDGEQNVTVG